MATIEEEEPAFSPRTEAQINFLLQAVRTGEAQLKEDSQGRLQIVYANERTIPLSHVDKSKAHAIQVGKNARDIGLRVDVCLEMIDAIKRSRAPSGVVIDQTKVGVSALGRYTEGQQFTHLEEVLGKGNCAGDIVVIKDKKTATEHALKTVMISEFSSHEVRAWVDLGDSDHFPSLYLFRLDGNKVVFHMEKVEHGVTLDDIINSHMANLHLKTPELIRPFSLCMFHGLLSAVREMHDKNWAHRDLHGGNVMITKDAMMLKILDFGMARPLREGFNFNHDALKNDILNAIRLFCGVYIGQDFGNNFILESEIKAGTLKKVLTETAHLSKEEREELLQLIMMTYQVTQNPQQAGYGSTAPVMECIEDRLFPDEKRDVMRQAAAVLFPDFYRTARDIALREKGEVEVVDGMTDDFDLEDAANAIPDDFLQELSICLGEDV